MDNWIRGSLLVMAAVLIAGCATNDLVGTEKANEPPQVWLSAAPPEGSVSEYNLHIYWGGWDPDGEVVFFEYAITNNESGVFDPADTTGADKWHRVYSNDSTFTFTADILSDTVATDHPKMRPYQFLRSHTFFIRSVDDEGLRSEKPAYRSFTSRTLSPIVDILIPTQVAQNPAVVPPVTTFKWVGKDFVSNERQVQEPDSVRWILVATKQHGGSWAGTIEYIRRNPGAPEWSDWHFYRAQGDTGRFWTSRPLENGAYMFAVQVMDEAGAVNPVFDEDRNMRRVLVAPRDTGPVLSVSNQYVGTIVTTSPNAPVTIIDLPAKVSMKFRWTANARGYGGVVSGYRYGWDIQDLSDDSQWDVQYTPFVTDNNSAESPPRTFEFDSHTFYVEVIDNSGYTSMVSVRLNIISFTMGRNLVLIDDYDEAGGASFARTNGGSPSDEEHDAFWNFVLGDLDGFDTDNDVVEVENELHIQRVADYKSMIWDTYGAYNLQAGISLLPELIHFRPEDPSILGAVTGKVQPNILALYMAAGGHVLLCGDQPMTSVVNPEAFAGGNKSAAFPIIFRYELLGDQDAQYQDSRVGTWGVGEGSFGYNECCVNVLDISTISNRRLIRHFPDQSCQTVTERSYGSRTEGLRHAIPIDTSYVFPELELRPEVADPGKIYAPTSRGLANDLYNPEYFADLEKRYDLTGTCNDVAEIVPPRECFQPMYGHGCLDTNTPIYEAPIAFWTSVFGDRIPDALDGVAARSAVWGFEPVYFKPEQVREALNVILFKEWQLKRKPPEASRDD